MRNARLTDQVLAALLSKPLDRQLAAGRPPGSSALLSARAELITGVRRRHDLARNWEHVVARARQPHEARPLAIAIRRDRVIAAEADIRELAARLRSPRPASAQGVAAAQLLLADGTGSLYHRAEPDEWLVIQLRKAVTHLEPSPPRPAGPGAGRRRPAGRWPRRQRQHLKPDRGECRPGARP